MRRLAQRIAFAVLSFFAITIVTFALLNTAKPVIEAAEPQASGAARARAALLADRYALDRPPFFNPHPPDAARAPDAAARAAVAERLPKLLTEDDFALARGLDELRRTAALPAFGNPRGAPGTELTVEERRHNAALRRDVTLWWRRHQNEYRPRPDWWRATIGKVTETRYAAWLGDLARLDFGDSVAIRPQTPVTELLKERFPPTLIVMIVATIVLFLVGVPLGVLCAAGRGGTFDRITQAVLFLLHATPEFWVATIALVYLCSDAHWHLFPVGGLLSPEIAEAWREGRLGLLSPRLLLDAAHHLVLPVLVLVFPAVVVVVRHLRAAALEALGSRFVTAARARGIPRRRILFSHVLRSCTPPAIALLSSVLPGLVTGSILIEVLFDVEGMGSLSWRAATHHDFPVGMAILTIVAVVMLVAHVLTDMLHAALDPRVKLS